MAADIRRIRSFGTKTNTFEEAICQHQDFWKGQKESSSLLSVVFIPPFVLAMCGSQLKWNDNYPCSASSDQSLLKILVLLDLHNINVPISPNGPNGRVHSWHLQNNWVEMF